MLTIRQAREDDAPLILNLVSALAHYEKAPQAVVATEADLLRDGFGPHPLFACLIAEWNAEPVGFALYCWTYSTWHGRRGIHLEDLFVQPGHRGRGIGKALLTRVAAAALQQGCSRLNWHVLDWNQGAIDFYQSLGAAFLDEWRIMRVAGDALTALAAQSTATQSMVTQNEAQPSVSSPAPVSQ